MIHSKFAEVSDLNNQQYIDLNKQLQELNIKYSLPNHTQLNIERFNNNPLILNTGTFYGSRMWEYPFAIINSDVSAGQKVADIGCGSTPFIAYLSKVAGAGNVTGFDNDFLKTDDTHFAFGVRKKFIEDTGINFTFSNIDAIDAPDETYDKVFCISVLEHIIEPAIWQKGLMEMARILKPGGKLILTFDICLSNKIISIGDILNYTNLIPEGKLDMNWPEKRFVNVDGVAMDVFGIVLTKPNSLIFADTNNSTQINKQQAFKKYLPEIISTQQMQLIKDIKKSKLRTLIKIGLNKYKG